MGVYCLNRRIVEHLEKGKPYGFDSLMIDGIGRRQRIGVKSFEGFWLDLGRPEDFDIANEKYEELKSKLGLPK
jgi:NDP-sugar pyrophosphorylase family protein